MDRKRKLGFVLFNNLLISSRKRMQKDFDDIYQSLEEPVDATDDGEDEEIMGTIAYGTDLAISAHAFL